MATRCPTCHSTVLLERETDRLALACLACGRRWEQLTPPERAYRAPLVKMRAEMQAGERKMRMTRFR